MSNREVQRIEHAAAFGVNPEDVSDEVLDRSGASIRETVPATATAARGGGDTYAGAIP